jgi:hypothetical protein
LARGIVPGEDGARLHRRWCDARALDRRAHDLGSAGESRVSLRLIAIFDIETDIARDVRMQRRRIRGKRLLEADHHRQILIIDLDQLGSIGRRRGAGRDHHRNFLADIAHAIGRQQRPLRHQDFAAASARKRHHRRHGLHTEFGNVAADEDGDHARRRLGRALIDAADRGMGAVGTAKGGVELTRQVEVGAVAPTARQQPLILAPPSLFRRHRIPLSIASTRL